MRSSELPHFISSYLLGSYLYLEIQPRLIFSFNIPGFSTLQSDCTHSRLGFLSSDDLHASIGIIISAYSSLNLLPPFSLLGPYSDYAVVNISLNNSFLVSFLNV